MATKTQASGGYLCTVLNRLYVSVIWLLSREYINENSQLLSVISLLSSDKPNLDSPANVDAAKEVRTDFEGKFSKPNSLSNSTLFLAIASGRFRTT